MVRLVRLLTQQLFVLVQQMAISLLYALPFVFGLLLLPAGASLKLTADAWVFALGRIPEIADRLSDTWMRRAIVAGFPYLWQRQLKWSFCGIVAFAIICVWLLMLFTLSFVVSQLFNV
jgi:hypothetical protein